MAREFDFGFLFDTMPAKSDLEVAHEEAATAMNAITPLLENVGGTQVDVEQILRQISIEKNALSDLESSQATLFNHIEMLKHEYESNQLRVGDHEAAIAKLSSEYELLVNHLDPHE